MLIICASDPRLCRMVNNQVPRVYCSQPDDKLCQNYSKVLLEKMEQHVLLPLDCFQADFLQYLPACFSIYIPNMLLFRDLPEFPFRLKYFPAYSSISLHVNSLPWMFQHFPACSFISLHAPVFDCVLSAFPAHSPSRRQGGRNRMFVFWQNCIL